MPWAFDSVKHGEWKREKFAGFNLYEKTLGIVGLGRLGRWMAKYGRAFGMKVFFCDPNVDESVGLEVGAEKVSFDDLLTMSDVVSINVDLSPKTENLFTAETFKKMKPSAILINTARGKVVNEKDLLTALQEKIVAGYATDVLADETSFVGGVISASYPLVEYSKNNQNLIIVPHIGGMTIDSRITTDVFMAKKVTNFLMS